MLRMYLLQCWFSLSDEGAEDAIYDSYAMRKVGAVPVDHLIIFPQKPCRYSDIVDIGGSGLHCVDKAAPGIHAGVALHTKMPLVSLFYTRHTLLLWWTPITLKECVRYILTLMEKPLQVQIYVRQED